MGSLYIQDINSMSDLYFENVFSYSAVCLITLIIAYFAVHKLFSLIQSHLFIFVFVLCAYFCGLVKNLLN
jgi:undecaprenyl pyrophosphate phosphatase UppP